MEVVQEVHVILDIDPTMLSCGKEISLSFEQIPLILGTLKVSILAHPVIHLGKASNGGWWL